MTTLAQNRFKLVCVGDGATGKTCMLITFIENKFPSGYVPTVFENYNAKFDVDGKPYEMSVWDTAGQEEYDSLRPLSYPNANIILICFAIDNHFSYENVVTKWAGEVRHYCSNAPVILVGTKTDLRTDPLAQEEMKKNNASFITPQMGQDLAKKINATKYLECSAKTRHNLKEIFEEAIRTITSKNDKPAVKKKKCILL
ncbi:gtp-binding protein rho4 [Anaeramoeba ignava]|uniref:Gtp-binding protein rho4 n=1 Tax=Anaeramoeba ignava TaxID=1746090 RepID=A0A9Q0RH07_ANAIG|nr:gtp-binding protein rho4 [Anaeramoeba ignava]